MIGGPCKTVWNVTPDTKDSIRLTRGENVFNWKTLLWRVLDDMKGQTVSLLLFNLIELGNSSEWNNLEKKTEEEKNGGAVCWLFRGEYKKRSREERGILPECFRLDWSWWTAPLDWTRPNEHGRHRRGWHFRNKKNPKKSTEKKKHTQWLAHIRAPGKKVRSWSSQLK